MLRYVAAVLLCFLPSFARADIVTESIDYEHNGVKFTGTIAYDNASEGKKPGILVVHDWMGHGPFSIGKAKDLAKLGYVGFAIDMYGTGVKPKNVQEASKLAGTIKSDRQLMRGRAQAALDVLKKHPRVDASKTAAIGFCFGGTTALELARSGTDISGVVSFHGGLETSTPATANIVKAKILALHGADDPFVPVKEVNDFQKEMQSAKCNWELVAYGNAVHSFTNQAAGTDNSKGAAFNAQANARSWDAMKRFFAELWN
jgi:dienelactone hydrolase